MLTGRAVVSRNNFGRIARRVAVARAANVGSTARRIQRDWKANAARRTGEYAENIEVHGPGDNASWTGAIVVATAESETGFPYPTAVEFGTRFMAAQPAAQPAAEAVRQGFVASFRGMLR